MPSTAAAIRDRITALITAASPTFDSRTAFRASQNVGAAAFVTECEGNPAGCFRRFQVRDDGTEEPPEVSNTDVDMRHVVYEIRVAYPHTQRYGKDGALDRDDAIDLDWGKLEPLVGIYARSQYTGAYDCTPLGATREIEIGQSVDFLVIRARYSYYRRVGGNAKPVASFTSSATVFAVTFTDTSTDDHGIQSWAWTFGDGGTSTSQNPTHTYSAAGDYTVTLTVTDQDYATSTTSSSVSVRAPLVGVVGQSNVGDNVDWSASDLGLGLSETFAGFNITRKIAGSDADPLVWAVDRARESLQPSASSNPNMGPMLSAGRMAAQHSITEGIQFSVSGCEIAKFLPDASYPSSGGNLFTRLVAMIQAAETASDTRFSLMIWSQGETDALDATKAGLWQSRAQTIFDELWETWPDLIVVIPRINDSAVATYLSTVIAGQDALAAANSTKVFIVSVDDLPMLDDFHYRATEMTTIGNRTMAVGANLLGMPQVAASGSSPVYLGSDGGVYRSTSLTTVIVSSRLDLVAGDAEVLTVAKGYGDGTISISDLRGFELQESDTSDSGGGVTGTSAVYTRIVTQEMLDDDDFVWSITATILNPHANDKIAAKIDAYRSSTGTIAIGATDVSVNDALGTAVSCPSITTTSANARVLNIVTGWCGSTSRTLSSITNASLSSLAQQQHSVLPVASGEGMMISTISGVKTAAGSVSATTATLDLYALQVNFTIELQAA